jgi:hypothetical protein
VQKSCDYYHYSLMLVMVKYIIIHMQEYEGRSDWFLH